MYYRKIQYGVLNEKFLNIFCGLTPFDTATKPKAPDITRIISNHSSFNLVKQPNMAQAIIYATLKRFNIHIGDDPFSNHNPKKSRTILILCPKNFDRHQETVPRRHLYPRNTEYLISLIRRGVGRAINSNSIME